MTFGLAGLLLWWIFVDLPFLGWGHFGVFLCLAPVSWLLSLFWASFLATWGWGSGWEMVGFLVLGADGVFLYFCFPFFLGYGCCPASSFSAVGIAWSWALSGGLPWSFSLLPFGDCFLPFIGVGWVVSSHRVCTIGVGPHFVVGRLGA